jgi:cytidylate kinase
MTTIFVFGPSCSGKSTLAEALEERLNWTRIDRDDLIQQERYEESAANQFLDQKIQQCVEPLIIDAQIPWRGKQEKELYVLVLPPLDALIKRDEHRNTVLHRESARAERARKYVINTHTELSALPKNSFDLYLDSSVLSLAQEVEQVVQRVSQ